MFSERVCAHESVCANTSKIERWGDCENREIDTANETNGGNKGREIREKKIEEAERRGLTSGYWSLTRHSKKESDDEAEVAGKERE